MADPKINPKPKQDPGIDLEPSCTAMQIVDGNNFLYNKLIKSTDIYMIRHIIRDINSCIQRPVFVFDGANNDERRRKLFPGYKVRKNPPNEVQQNLYMMMRLVKALLLLTNSIQIEVPTYEADDVIATLAKQRSKQGKAVRVITRDRDLAQLACYQHVSVLSHYADALTPNLIRLQKTLVGDPSDCIPGIPGFGRIAFSNCNKGEFKQMLNHSEWHPRFDGPTLGVKDSIANWISENFGLLKSYWQIVDLLEVPDEEIQKHMKVGQSNPDAVNNILREFML